MSASEFFSGTVEEANVYVPVPAPPKNRYQVVAAAAEFLPGDPTAPEDQAFKRISRFRVRWQLVADGAGNPSEYAGRLVDQTIYDQEGPNPKTGHPNRQGLYDLIRLRSGVDMKSDVTGRSLYDTHDLQGMERDEVIRVIDARFRDAVVGLKAIVTLYHKKQTDGTAKEQVAKIISAI